MKKLSAIFFASILILTSNNVYAEPDCKPDPAWDCLNVLEKADQYIQKLEEHSLELTNEVDLFKEETKYLQEELNRRDDWWKQPEFIVPFTIISTIGLTYLIQQQVNK